MPIYRDCTYSNKTVKASRFVQIFALFFVCVMVALPSFADDDDDKKSKTKDDDDKKSYTQLLNEVFRTELVYPQAKGEVQISLIPSYFKQREEKNVIFPVEVEYGLTDAWQLDVFAETFIIHDPNEGKRTKGFGDMGFGTKYSFMNICKTHYSASLNFEISFPTGNIDKGLTDGFRVYEPSISFAKDFPNFYSSQLFAQVGFEFLQRIKKPKSNGEGEQESEEVGVLPEAKEIEPQAHSFFVNVGYFIPSGIARFVAEINWETNRWNHGGKENLLYFTPGVVWEPTKHWELATGGSVGLNKTSDPYV